ncbi:hypothetical protein GF420_06715 [candidate division GN15 bacterium]|nr:hypothetical protein [candidate division GN15 bacterium]
MRPVFVLCLCTVILGTAAFGETNEERFRAELATDSTNASLLYNLACVVALDCRAEEAMELLTRSIHHGFNHFEHLLVNDPDLTTLRQDPTFRDQVYAAIEKRRVLLLGELRKKPYLAKRNHFELAVVAAELNDTARVIESLASAFEAGFKDFHALWNNSSFGPYWRHDPFRELADGAFDNTFGWTGSDEQKLFGLMTVWSEAKRNFAFFDQVPALDWDAECQSYIPKVLAAESVVDYYHLLQELTARLQDGHTGVFLPGSTRRDFDNLPVELTVIDDQVYVARLGRTEELAASGLAPGMAIDSIDGIDARAAIRKRVERRFCYGRTGGTLAIGMGKLFEGPADRPVRLTWRDFDNRSHTAAFTRTLTQSDSTRFNYRSWITQPTVRFERLDGDIMYCELLTFNTREVVDQFRAVFDTLDLATVNGFIFDVRYNTGGNSSHGFAVISHLIDEPIPAAKWMSRKYIPTHRAWGREESWFDGGQMAEIQPAEGERFTGPVVVLIGPHTFSAAEDFVVPLDYSDRAILVGDTTAGSTGQPLSMLLPGGGTFRVCTKRDVYPDGRDFVGVGIAPDVHVALTHDDLVAGRDAALEKALTVAKNKIDK